MVADVTRGSSATVTSFISASLTLGVFKFLQIILQYVIIGFHCKKVKPIYIFLLHHLKIRRLCEDWITIIIFLGILWKSRHLRHLFRNKKKLADRW